MVEAVVFAGISTLLYHLGMGFLLFLAPLQMLLVRKGPRSFGVSLGLAFVFILAVKLVTQGGGLDSRTAPFVLLEMFVVLALMGGLVLLQLPELWAEARQFAVRRVTRLVLVTAVAGMLSVPVIVHLRNNESFNTGMLQVFDSLAAGLRRTFGEDALREGSDATQPPTASVPQAPFGSREGSDALLGTAVSSGQALMAFVGRIFWRGFLFAYFLLLAGAWWLGTWAGTRLRSFRAGPLFAPAQGGPEQDRGGLAASKAGEGFSGIAEPPRIAEFRLPDSYIWPLIGSLALVLLALVQPLGILEPIAWNAAVILMFLYGISGIGVVQHFLRKLRVPRGMRWLLAFLLIVLVLSPRANLAVFILIPGLGVSEIWLKYRTKERSNG